MSEVKPKSDDGSSDTRATPERALFECTDLRREIQARWRAPQYRDMSIARLRSLESRDALGRKVQSVLAEVKGALSPRPWHSTLRLVSFDMAMDKASQVISLIERFVAEKENIVVVRDKGTNETREESVGNTIVEAVPGMKEHADTALYMADVILPFRSFVVAQIVSSLMDPHGDPSEDGEEDAGMAPVATNAGRRATRGAATTAMDSTSNGNKNKNVTVPKAQATQRLRFSHQHAAHHAKDIDDVLEINAMMDECNKVALKRHIDNYKKQNVCTRYAEYCLLFLTMDSRTATDKEWSEKLRPLAEAGLAHAQHDLGMVLMRMGQPAAAVAWLERAAALGHSRSMLQLGKYHMNRVSLLQEKAIGRSVRAAAVDVVARQRDESLATSAALRAFDMLGEANWDDGTCDDLSQAAVLLRELRKVSAKQLAARQNSSPWRLWFYIFFSLLVVYFAWHHATKTSSVMSLPVFSRTEDLEPTHVSPYQHPSAR